MDKIKRRSIKYIRRIIPLARVHERPGLNSRFEMPDIAELAASIGDPRTGLLFPPLVVKAEDITPDAPNKNHYYIVHGYRRVAALKMLKWKRAAFFVAVGLTLQDQYIINLAENARENLTPAEIADRAYNLIHVLPLGKRPSAERLAEKCGMSSSHVRNLVRLRRDLHPELWKVFVNLGHQAKIGAFLSILPLAPANQLVAWRKWHEVKEEQPRGGRGRSLLFQRIDVLMEKAKGKESAEFLRGAQWIGEELGWSAERLP